MDQVNPLGAWARQRPRLVRNLIIGLIVLLGAVGSFYRVYDLENNPPGLWQDEASTGLDAYLLWHTGADRSGARFPIISKSLGFGDYPLTLYRYLDAPIVGLLGPTPGRERLVAALAGILMLLATSIAAGQLFGRGTGIFALLSGAFCPTWIHFSRFGSEAMLLPLCMIGGMALIHGGQKRRSLIWWGAIVLGLAGYTYHAVKIMLPLWMIGFLWFEWPFIRELWAKERRHLVGPALLFTAVIGPSVYTALTPQGMSRGTFVLAWYHSSGIQVVRVILNNYLSYFDPGMLFVRGGPAVAQTIPGAGMWSLIELPLMLVALRQFVVGTKHRRAMWFVLWWMLIGPIPGGLTYEAQNMGRAIGWLPAPTLLAAYGMKCAVESLLADGSAVRRRLALFGALVVGWTATGAYIGYMTLVEYPKNSEVHWQFAITRALECAKSARKPGELIVVSPRFHLGELFAQFHLSEVPPVPEGKKRYVMQTRTKVGRSEIYVMKNDGKKPKGKLICTISTRAGRPQAQVWGHDSEKQPFMIRGNRPTLNIPERKPVKPQLK